MTEPFTLHRGDCIEVLRAMPDNSIDSIVTDPPYGLSKEPDMAEVLRHWLAGDDYKHTGSGFMGKSWDSFVPGPSAWREALRVLKPGGYLLSFFGTRTYDIGTLAIRLAGFEIRDQIDWIYGSGFPKSLDVSKAIAAGSDETLFDDEGNPFWCEECGEAHGTVDMTHALYCRACAAREWQGWGTALKPAHEPICVARKPLAGTVAANVLQHGTGALNIDGCRVETSAKDQEYIAKRIGGFNNTRSIGGNGAYSGGETMDRAASYDATKGRWPANVIHDGSEEVLAAFPDAPEQQAAISSTAPSEKTSNVYGRMRREGEASANSANDGTVGFKMKPGMRRLDSGSAARFFYCAKASRAERNAGCDHLPNKNNHPTVKPVALSAYLCRLITPPGGTVLDLYTGSGSIGIGAIEGGFVYIGIDKDEDENGKPLGYLDIADARITHAIAKTRGTALLDEVAA